MTDSVMRRYRVPLHQSKADAMRKERQQSERNLTLVQVKVVTFDIWCLKVGRLFESFEAKNGAYTSKESLI